MNSIIEWILDAKAWIMALLALSAIQIIAYLFSVSSWPVLIGYFLGLWFKELLKIVQN